MVTRFCFPKVPPRPPEIRFLPTLLPPRPRALALVPSSTHMLKTPREWCNACHQWGFPWGVVRFFLHTREEFITGDVSSKYDCIYCSIFWSAWPRIGFALWIQGVKEDMNLMPNSFAVATIRVYHSESPLRILHLRSNLPNSEGNVSKWLAWSRKNRRTLGITIQILGSSQQWDNTQVLQSLWSSGNLHFSGVGLK